MLGLWEIGIYFRLLVLVVNKAIWSWYDLEKKIHWRLVVRTFILKTSIIDVWFFVWLGYFQQWVRFNFFSAMFFCIYMNFTEIDFTEIDVKSVSWENPTRFLKWFQFVAICIIYVKRW